MPLGLNLVKSSLVHLSLGSDFPIVTKTLLRLTSLFF